MKEYIPVKFRNFFGSIYSRIGFEYKKWKIKHQKINLPTKREIILNYAGLVPSLNEVVGGGRVKLKHLAEIFPENQTTFNLLYLISSCQPVLAEVLVDTYKKAGVKIIWNQNGVGYPAWAGENYNKINEPMRRLIHKADFVVYQSEFCKVCADKFLGEVKSPLAIIYNCVDTNIFSPNKVTIPISPLRLLVMGSHNQSYRVFLALDTLSILLKKGIDSKLRIAGRLLWSKTAKDELEQKIDELNLNEHVVIYGSYLQSDAPNLYKESHILLHYKYNDACPTVPIEAMACGVPVVASGSGGTKELVSNEGGILLDAPLSFDTVHYPNPNNASEAVITILKDLGNWQKKARNRAVTNFDKVKWQEEHKKVFQKILF